jgi:transcriptional regulator with XRE-family HTH domain
MTILIRSQEDLAGAVRERRHELGLSQEQLAGVVGLHRVSIGYLEAGERSLGFEHVLRIVQALGLDLELRSRDT